MDVWFWYVIGIIVCAPLLPLIPWLISRLLLKTLDPKVQELLKDE